MARTYSSSKRAAFTPIFGTTKRADSSKNEPGDSWYIRLMSLAEELKERGLLEHSSADVEKIFAKPRTVYLGVDPTADSMQIGNLAVVLLMHRLANAGHKLVFVVGGGTGMIGDPREKGE